MSKTFRKLKCLAAIAFSSLYKKAGVLSPHELEADLDARVILKEQACLLVWTKTIQ